MQQDKHYIIGPNAYPAPKVETALYLVATPIGNLGDITIRALETLAGVDIIACEDTRVSRTLLERFAIKQRPIAYHEHNANAIQPKLMGFLTEGKSIALISDAGTPLISDPGFKLVEEARKAGFKVVPIPGASAALTALIATGLPTDQFLFAGFLPAKKSARQNKLQEIAHLRSTLIFYESPHRTVETLQDMVKIFGPQRQAALCRELTKKYETIDVQPLEALCGHYKQVERIRGEIVLIIAPFEDTTASGDEDIDQLLLQAAQEMPPAKAANEVAKMTNQSKPELYKRLLALKGR